MRKTVMVAGILGLSAVTTPLPAEARIRGFDSLSLAVWAQLSRIGVLSVRVRPRLRLLRLWPRLIRHPLRLRLRLQCALSRGRLRHHRLCIGAALSFLTLSEKAVRYSPSTEEDLPIECQASIRRRRGRSVRSRPRRALYRMLGRRMLLLRNLRKRWLLHLLNVVRWATRGQLPGSAKDSRATDYWYRRQSGRVVSKPNEYG